MLPDRSYRAVPERFRKAVTAHCAERAKAFRLLPTSLYLIIVLQLSGAAIPIAHAQETHEDEIGILNPDDTGRDMLRRKLAMGELDPVTCSLGFNNAKYDDLPLARRFAHRCAEAGVTKAMTWMSYLETNGLGGPVDLEAAALWDQRAADAGSPVGMYNYGLDLIQGKGVARNVSLGREYIDKAASLGLIEAKKLKAADYDPAVATPDADDWQRQALRQ